MTAYLVCVDQEAPGVVEALYLTGSTALGDFRPHASDIDFLAVIPDKADPVVVAALARAHERLRAQVSRPFFDGLYVTWEDLARDPAQTDPGPYSSRGRFHPAGAIDCGPVLWHTLARHGVGCRGPEPATLRTWTDPEALRSWTLRNFEAYWRPLIRRARFPGHPWSLIAFTSYGAMWVVLGVCRLHYTLTTGAIVSKEAAGRYGLTIFAPRWHRALNESLRIRRADRARADVTSAAAELIDDLRIRRPGDGGSLYRTPIGRRNDALAFAEMVMADADRRAGTVFS